jgi:hypothetical protein
MIFFFFAVLGFELRALHLLGRCSSTQVTPSAFCALIISQVESDVFGRA